LDWARKLAKHGSIVKRMPDLPEARIPCPLCGGPIHPVAGRCKHCKGDLAALRTGKPQAQAALPALGNRTVDRAPPPGPQLAARRQAAHRIPMPAVDPSTATFSTGSELPSQPVLPPRPTGRMFAAVPQTPMWPMIVIVLSVLATLIAIGAIVSS